MQGYNPFLCGFFLYCAIYGVNTEPTMSFTEVSTALKIFLNQMVVPIRVTAMVCWHSDFTHRFIREFHNANKNTTGIYQLALTRPDVHRFPDKVAQPNNEVIVIDVTCNSKDLQDLLERVRKPLMMYFKWIFINAINSKNMGDVVSTLLKAQHILPRSEIFYMAKRDDQHFLYTQIYRTTENGPMIKKIYGEYINGKFIAAKTSIFESRRNLMNTNLRAVTVLTSANSLQYYYNYSDKSTDTLSKAHLCLITDFMQFSNTTINFNVIVKLGHFNESTNTATGLFKQLTHKEVDIAATGFLITEPRVSKFQFITVPVKTAAYFFFRIPNLSYTDNVFMLPFDRPVWFCFMMLLLILTLFLGGVVMIEWTLSIDPETDVSTDDTILRPSINDSLVLVLSAALQQGTSVTPRSMTARVIVILSFISLMFLYTSYSANIVGLLQSPSMRIQTLQQIFDSRLTMALEDNEHMDSYFSMQTDPLRKSIYQEKIQNSDGSKNMFRAEVGMEKVRQDYFAFHTDRNTAHYIVSATFLESEKCGLRKIKYMNELPPYIAIPKNSSYYEIIKIGILRLMEHGIQDRHNMRLYTAAPKCGGNTANFAPASLLDTAPAFLALAWGFAATTVIFICELLWKAAGSKHIPIRLIGLFKKQLTHPIFLRSDEDRLNP